MSQSEIDRLASDISVTAEVVTNLKNSGKEHTTRITLKNTGTSPIQNGWRLYFHSFYLLYPTVFPKDKSIDLPIEKIKVIMVQGDLYALEPLPGFKAINSGESREIEMIVQYWSVSRTDFMPRWYLTSSDGTGEPRILTSTNTLSYVKPFADPRQWKRYDFDKYNPFTAQDRKARLGVIDAKMVRCARACVRACVRCLGTWRRLALTTQFVLQESVSIRNGFDEWVARHKLGI